jgi:hypothetical protein
MDDPGWHRAKRKGEQPERRGVQGSLFPRYQRRIGRITNKESRLSAVSFERNQHPNNNRKRKDSYNARRYERTNNGFSVRESRVSPTHQLF